MTARRRLITRLAIVCLLVGLSACAGGRISLGTATGECFRALPPAKTAVHGQGKLVGVRRVSASTLRARLPRESTLASLPDENLCVFAFNGNYAAGSVTGANPARSGRFAIVAVTTKKPAVVGAAVVDKLPTRFQHLH